MYMIKEAVWHLHASHDTPCADPTVSDLTPPPCSVPVSNGRVLNSVVKGYSSEILTENKCTI